MNRKKKQLRDEYTKNIDLKQKNIFENKGKRENGFDEGGKLQCHEALWKTMKLKFTKKFKIIKKCWLYRLEKQYMLCLVQKNSFKGVDRH